MAEVRAQQRLCRMANGGAQNRPDGTDSGSEVSSDLPPLPASRRKIEVSPDISTALLQISTDI